ncbi:MAG TPA: DUF2231 domain-containing protein [Candidatus Polarisedimenticolaceae bacterium]|nr:DUF2231 domain-containing protein [Candidatus Polarisedimenticolaceae bacterium]
MLHLIHPALVHLTVAFLIAGGVVEALGVLRQRASWEATGTVLVVTGTLALIPTLITGFLAENSLTLTEAGAAAVDQHERYGIMVLGVFLPLLLVRAWGRGRVPEGARRLYAAGLLAGVALTVLVAFLGGRMVYELGVGVGK